MNPSAYRSEIDGLRAVSVVVILLFHLQFFRFSGGFVGVDVFFVISGFLITNIILGELQEGRFSFRRFYVRRIARIIPALLVTVTVSLAAATVLYTPPLLEHAMRQGLAALLSVSNIYFWVEADYWQLRAKDFLFLHTWSLGVEEQFYLFYPLLLVACRRFLGARGVLVFLLVLVIAGTAAAEHVLATDATAAFYLTPLRLNEFAMGGLGSILLPHLPVLRGRWTALTSAGTLGGLGMIFYSATTFGYLTRFPGVNSLLPTLGALLVILCGASGAARTLLGNAVMTWAGRLSYSLYLVHWPLIVLYRYLLGPHLDLVDQMLLGLASFAAAMVLNRSVEMRFRLASGDRVTRSGIPARRTLLLTGCGMVLLSLVALAGIGSRGWPGRMPPAVQSLAGADLRIPPELKERLASHCSIRQGAFCGSHREDGVNIMLLADSRAYDMFVALRTAYPDHNIYTSYALGCAPLIDPRMSASRFYGGCAELNRMRMQAALDAPEGEVVFLAMDLSAWRSASAVATARQLVQSGKRAYVMGQSQFLQGKVPRDIAIDQQRWSEDETYIERYLVRKPFDLDRRFAAEFEKAGAIYISNRDFFYQGHYRLFTRDGDDLLSYDGKHLTPAGAEEFGHYLAQKYPLD